MLKKMFLTSGHLTLLTHLRSKLLEKGENSDYSEFMCNILKGLTLPETELLHGLVGRSSSHLLRRSAGRDHASGGSQV